MKGIGTQDGPLSDVAACSIGFYPGRGVGVQTAVMPAGAEDFDGATVYLDLEEARLARLQLEAAIKQAELARRMT